MSRLASVLADHIRSQINASAVSEGSNEVRLIFLGPPQELMVKVFEDLVGTANESAKIEIPILLQVPRDKLQVDNPLIGASGWCDEDHLLDLRNLPHSASFVALIPPGEHSILSVGSTTDKFGVSESSNGGNATFEAWWDDSFIQNLVIQAVTEAGLSEPLIDEAKHLVEAAARSADEVASASAYRVGAWRLISRLFSIDRNSGQIPGNAISLACGVPPMRSGSLSAKEQLGILRNIAETMSEGFRRSIERLEDGASDDDRGHLKDFLEHVRSACDVATMFDRGATEYYRPIGDYDLSSAPEWWVALDVEKWTDLLSDEPSSIGDIDLICTNSLVALGKATPAIVSGDVILEVRTEGGNQGGQCIGVTRTPAAGNGVVGEVDAAGRAILVDAAPPPHKSPLTFKASAPNFKSGSIKVVSLATWQPGILVACRLTRKLSPPRKPTKRGNKAGPDWETTLNLPGPGRYELLVFVSPGVTLAPSSLFSSDQADGGLTAPTPVKMRQTTPEIYRVEIEAEGNCQLDLGFSRTLKDNSTVQEICRTFMLCDDVPEVGCRSELERLIKTNRRQLESFDTKVVIPVNRAIRSTMFQDWILSEECVRTSYQPVVMAEDYEDYWSPPDWGTGGGPILSGGAFIS
jgi:DNA phosphorothioation-dependent restriction protein DptH